MIILYGFRKIKPSDFFGLFFSRYTRSPLQRERNLNRNLKHTHKLRLSDSFCVQSTRVSALVILPFPVFCSTTRTLCGRINFAITVCACSRLTPAGVPSARSHTTNLAHERTPLACSPAHFQCVRWVHRALLLAACVFLYLECTQVPTMLHHDHNNPPASTSTPRPHHATASTATKRQRVVATD